MYVQRRIDIAFCIYIKSLYYHSTLLVAEYYVPSISKTSDRFVKQIPKNKNKEEITFD